jgi:hypothetical protein
MTWSSYFEEMGLKIKIHKGEKRILLMYFLMHDWVKACLPAGACKPSWLTGVIICLKSVRAIHKMHNYVGSLADAAIFVLTGDRSTSGYHTNLHKMF